MKKTILGCLGAAVVAFTMQFTPVNVHAGLFSDCAPCDEITDCDLSNFDSCDPCDSVCGTKAGKWFVNGFIEAGIWANEFGNTNNYHFYSGNDGRHNGNLYPGNRPALQNVQHTGFQANQVYFSVGRSVDGKHGWDFGGQADFVYGTDAWMVQSRGMEKNTAHDQYGWGTGDYYSAFAQAYFQAAYKDLNVYAGKFYAPFGSQEFRGDNNFFYSFAPTYDFVPRTASGVYATYKLSNNLTVLGGWIVPDMIGETSRNNAFLGGAIWQATKKFNLKYVSAIGQIGKEYSNNPAGAADVDYFVNSLVATYNINKRWKTVFDWTLFNTQIDAWDYDYTAWGINTALYYQYSKTLSFGARYTYISGSNYAYENFGGNNDGRYGINGFYGNFGRQIDDWTTISFGANWAPTQWLVVKPEVRWDIIEGGNNVDYFRAHGTNRTATQFSGGVSTVVKF